MDYTKNIKAYGKTANGTVVPMRVNPDGKLNISDTGTGIQMHAHGSIENPQVGDSFAIGFRVDAASTLQKVVFNTIGGTSVVGQLSECTAVIGTGATNTQAADSTVTAQTAVTSFTNAGIVAGRYWRFKIAAINGAVSRFEFDAYYKKD